MIELNLDAGEKQLLALYRALIESSRRIVVLARKRSNVDVEMDAQFWKLFSLLEVSSSTLLCITEHIDTILYYKIVLVINAVTYAGLDRPFNLFNMEDSIFRSLYNEAGLFRQIIVRTNIPGVIEA
ncbi:hypothetical protein IEO21_10951 [Rhodonia placenta]|uniref:Uncharacterized protein n=1 Tax=Rhodonia placenta TaxID=104341 RepID=A0A8H7NRG9_9APHY|nr:hypothetical protein IEO21_10951 [Postia placenta]